MSGFEIAGIVLGTIPLVVSGLEAYSKLMRDWGKAPSELKSLNRQLRTEQSRLYNVCDQLISDVVPQRDVEPMLQDPFGSLWQAQETKDRIRQRLWDSYRPFEETVVEVGEALESVMQRLRIEVTHDGQVTWVNQRKVPREFKKLLYRMNRKDYQDSLDTISRGVTDLEKLARLSVALEPARRKRSRGKVFKILRDLSTSIYRALCSSLVCWDSHDVTLELATRFIEVTHEGEDEKILRDAQFKVAISFEVAEGSATKRFWNEVNIKTATAPKSAPYKPCAVMTEEKVMKRVSFSLKKALSLNSSGKPSPNMKSALAVFTRPATDIAFVETTYDKTGGITGPAIDLCLALKSGREGRPACYGHLSDKENLNRCFQVQPLETTISSDEWSLVTLDDVLQCKNGVRPFSSLAERVKLALAISASVLQLSKTPWLQEALTRKNIYFFRRGNSLSYSSPFLLRTFKGGSVSHIKATSSNITPGCAVINNPTLFALGVLLLEIILSASLDQLRMPEESSFQGDDLGIMRDFITAHRLLEQEMASVNTGYKAVIQRCIGCHETKDLDEDSFREKVYSGVVMELEAIFEHTKLGE
ncbi:hypothetical protein FALBO_11146 [Fusarium albosuccineum]|uniref:DUF7580 domain-containing protein n=1 Tax=Fusarium albosuccineum TaxID=1237068 RepID=A0A8H4L6F6_9HYPO|nr:hypothetical protein FALBO_11146 [Fusarium albosuccineum]